MKILVVNDDGIADPGLWALAAAMLELGEVRVYSPDRNRSGAGMSISLQEEFHLRPTEAPAGLHVPVPAFSVDATPATLALIGCLHAYPGGPDLIVSGINAGWNPGIQTYVSSGTVGAARVAVDRGLTGVAVSAAYGAQHTYAEIAARTARMVRAMSAAGVLGEPLLINVNVPAELGPEMLARLTTPARFGLFEGVRLVDQDTSHNGATTLRVKFGDYFDGSTTPGDEMDALGQGDVSVCVTRPFQSRVVRDGPWPAIAAAFGSGHAPKSGDS